MMTETCIDFVDIKTILLAELKEVPSVSFKNRIQNLLQCPLQKTKSFRFIKENSRKKCGSPMITGGFKCPFPTCEIQVTMKVFAHNDDELQVMLFVAGKRQHPSEQFYRGKISGDQRVEFKKCVAADKNTAKVLEEKFADK